MKDKLWQTIIEMYGTQCNNHREEIEKRIDVMLAALLFAGEEGDNPLCELNRAFKKITHQ